MTIISSTVLICPLSAEHRAVKSQSHSMPWLFFLLPTAGAGRHRHGLFSDLAPRRGWLATITYLESLHSAWLPIVRSPAQIWLTQEADAKSWPSLKHVKPKEGRKELAPRGTKFRYRRLDTAIRERADSSQERRKRAKHTPGYFSLFLFSLYS